MMTRQETAVAAPLARIAIMEALNLRAIAALVGGVLAIVAIAVVVVRIVRARATHPQPPADLPVLGTDPAFLDSSHIIGPTTISPEPAAPGAEKAERDGEAAKNRGGGRAP